MTENSFKFKSGDLEIEFSGERAFVEEQIKDWKKFIETGTNTIRPKNELTFKNEAKSEVTSHIMHSEPRPLHPGIEPFSIPDSTKIEVKKNITLDEFFQLKSPENDSDKIIAAAYYLERYEKYDSFLEEDIINLIKIDDTKRLLEDNLEKGFLALNSHDDNSTGYTLTFSGEIYVREGFHEF